MSISIAHIARPSNAYPMFSLVSDQLSLSVNIPDQAGFTEQTGDTHVVMRKLGANESGRSIDLSNMFVIGALGTEIGNPGVTRLRDLALLAPAGRALLNSMPNPSLDAVSIVESLINCAPSGTLCAPFGVDARAVLSLARAIYNRFVSETACVRESCARFTEARVTATKAGGAIAYFTTGLKSTSEGANSDWTFLPAAMNTRCVSKVSIALLLKPNPEDVDKFTTFMKELAKNQEQFPETALAMLFSSKKLFELGSGNASYEPLRRVSVKTSASEIQAPAPVSETAPEKPAERDDIMLASQDHVTQTAGAILKASKKASGSKLDALAACPLFTHAGNGPDSAPEAAESGSLLHKAFETWPAPWLKDQSARGVVERGIRYVDGISATLGNPKVLREHEIEIPGIIRGILDIVVYDEDAGIVHIMDFKTTQSLGAHSMQLHAYAAGFLHGSSGCEKLYLHVVAPLALPDVGEIIASYETPAEVNCAIAGVYAAIASVGAGLDQEHPGTQCKNCSRLGMCKTAQNSFATLMKGTYQPLSNTKYNVLDLANFADKWASEKKSDARKRMSNGETIPGWAFSSSVSPISIDNAKEAIETIREHAVGDDAGAILGALDEATNLSWGKFSSGLRAAGLAESIPVFAGFLGENLSQKATSGRLTRVKLAVDANREAELLATDEFEPEQDSEQDSEQEQALNAGVQHIKTRTETETASAGKIKKTRKSKQKQPALVQLELPFGTSADTPDQAKPESIYRPENSITA